MGLSGPVAILAQVHAPPTALNLTHVAMAAFTRDEVIGLGRTRSSDRSVNTQDVDWHRRRDKRKAAISSIQETEAYRALSRKLHTLEALDGHPCGSAFPIPPDATDRTTSKRAWEAQLMAYRVAIKQKCRDEGVDPRSTGGLPPNCWRWAQATDEDLPAPTIAPAELSERFYASASSARPCGPLLLPVCPSVWPSSPSFLMTTVRGESEMGMRHHQIGGSRWHLPPWEAEACPPRHGPGGYDYEDAPNQDKEWRGESMTRTVGKSTSRS